MNDTWSLKALYKGFEDPKFQTDFQRFHEMVDEVNTAAKTISHHDDVASVKQILQIEEAYSLLTAKLANYLSLRQSTNTSDNEIVAYLGRLQNKASEAVKAFTKFDAFIAEIDELEILIQKDDLFQSYAYLLRETKANAQYQLSEEVEEVIAKLDISGGSAWGSLQEYLTSTLNVKYQDKELTLSKIRNLAYSDNAMERKAAYEAELAAYDNIKDSIAFSINNIKAQVSVNASLRGFTSPLAMTLHDARMKQETLDAMFTAMKSYMPYFRKYLKRKAKLLGYEHGLPWYELFAPLGETHKRYTLEEAKAYLVSHFESFAPDLTNMIKQAFDEDWIDFYPRKGKVGGAFCANLPYLKQSRILSNYDGQLGDIITLAHELGHAYHGLHIQDHRILNTHYSMPVAETASTFNENIIMNAAIQDAEGEEQLVLIENQLQDLTQITCDIYSRFLFEKAVFEKRNSQFMFADELANMMLEAQKEAYGDGLNHTQLHPYMWINKSHYYSSHQSYYNFPYTFGGLFARGLVAKYEQEGDSFVAKYQALLHATTIASVEEVAKMADIDVTSLDFWNQSLETCKDRIEQFLALTAEKE